MEELSMNFWEKVITFLDSAMTKPESYGMFHLIWFAFFIVAAVLLCVFHKKGSDKRVVWIVFGVAVVVTLLEIYKQINYTFSVGESGIVSDYQWYAFPWQFCSMPMYVGLLAGIIRKGKVHDALCSFLATYAIFAGLCVMFYPGDVFVGTIGINVQTMICHGSMITVGVYLLYTGHVKVEHKTILKAMPVFACAVGLAAIMNEVAFRTGLLERETFNMFYISPHCDPHLPVYSLVQQVVPFPWCLVIYILGFTAASYIILLTAIGIKKLASVIRK